MKRQSEMLQYDATRDALTGFPNRRAFDAVLSQSIAGRHASHRHGIGVLIIDIDHSKRFNDEFGHEFGDSMLQQVAAAIQGALRGDEFVGRYGGQRFAVLLDVMAADLLAVAERIRQSVERVELKGPASRRSVTVSVGGAYSRGLATAEAGRDLLGAAARCLYGAKRNGRNRSHLAAAATA